MMYDKTQPLTLYFIAGSAPTDADRAAASALPGRVVFRNAGAVDLTGSLEACDAVAGFVPSNYAAAHHASAPIDTPEPAVKKSGKAWKPNA